MIEKAEEVFEDAVGKGIIPNNGMYNGLIFAYANSGKPIMAEKAFLQMKENGISPNAANYTTLAHAYIKTKNIAKVITILTY